MALEVAYYTVFPMHEELQRLLLLLLLLLRYRWFSGPIHGIKASIIGLRRL